MEVENSLSAEYQLYFDFIEYWPNHDLELEKLDFHDFGLEGGKNRKLWEKTKNFIFNKIIDHIEKKYKIWQIMKILEILKIVEIQKILFFPKNLRNFAKKCQKVFKTWFFVIFYWILNVIQCIS